MMLNIFSHLHPIPLLLFIVSALGLSGCNQELMAERDALKLQVERLNKQLATAQAERAQWQAQHAEAEQTLLTIRQELQAELEQQAKAIKQARLRNQDKIQQLQALQAAQGALRAEIGQRESELVQIEIKLQDALEERETLERQLAQVQSDLEMAQAQRDDWQNRYHEADQALKTLQVELTTAGQGQSGGEARRALAAQLVQRNTELTQLRAQYDIVEAQLQSVNTAQQTRTTEVLDRLEETLDRFGIPEGGNGHPQKGGYEQNGHESAATQALTAMREELTGLKQIFEASHASQTALRSDLQTMLRQELDTLKTNMSQQTARHFETARTALKTQLAQSQLDLAKQQERLRHLRAEHEAANARRAQLQTELDAVRIRQSQCEAKHANTLQTLDTTRGRATNLEDRLLTMQHALDRYQSASQSQQHRLNHLYEVTSAQLQTAIHDQVVALQPQADRMLLRVGGNILFNPGQVTLRPEGQQTLDEVAAILNTFPSSTIRIEGHTDDRPIKERRGGCWPTNWELSAVRAASAARYLETRGVAPGRMTVSGASFHHPLASNETREGRTQNRRLEIIVHPNGQ